MDNTLNSEQIKTWRRIIFMQLERRLKGAGTYAIIMPESEVIRHWQVMKAIVEQPEQVEQVELPKITKNITPCSHSNSFTGSQGKYCIDCEEYV